MNALQERLAGWEAMRDRAASDCCAWRLWAAPVLLAALALLLVVPRLAVPGEYVFDELYYAYTAGKYVAGEDDAYPWGSPPRDRPAIEWTHPPVAKLLIAGGNLVLGDNPIGWRASSVLFGVAGVAVTYFLAIALTGSRAIVALAGGMFFLDGVYQAESRTGMSNLFLLVFCSAALLSFSRVLAALGVRPGPALFATGVLLGLAIATKWSAVALASLIALAFAWRSWLEAKGSLWALTIELGRGALAFGLVPVAIYLLSYDHFFHTGHGWHDLVTLHQAMLAYHRELGVVHAYSSS